MNKNLIYYIKIHEYNSSGKIISTSFISILDKSNGYLYLTQKATNRQEYLSFESLQQELETLYNDERIGLDFTKCGVEIGCY